MRRYVSVDEFFTLASITDASLPMRNAFMPVPAIVSAVAVHAEPAKSIVLQDIVDMYEKMLPPAWGVDDGETLDCGGEGR